MNPLAYEAIERARAVRLTPDEREAQCISFAYGNGRLENAAITREMIRRAYERLYGAQPTR